MKLFFLILFLASLQAFSQDSLIQCIDSSRLEYNAKIMLSHEEEMDFFPPRFTINSTLMERAIGEVKTSTTIYFDRLEGDHTDHKPPKDYALIRNIDVTIESGSYFITNNFYFSKTGELKYYYYKEEGYECYNQSYYFNLNKCIKIAQVI